MNTDEKIISKFVQDHTGEVLHFIENLKDEEIADLIESLPIELSILLLSQMDRFKAARSLEKIDIEVAIQIMEKIPLSTSELLLRQMDTVFCNLILDGLPLQNSKLLQSILKYPKDSVGAHINPIVFTLRENQNISQGLEKIKKDNPDLHSRVFVLSQDQSLAGFIELKDLIIMDANTSIRSAMNINLPKIRADINISSLIERWDYDESFLQLPVVDANEAFLGVVTKEKLSSISSGKNTHDHPAIKAGSALGDLYQIGLSGLFRSAGTISKI